MSMKLIAEVFDKNNVFVGTIRFEANTPVLEGRYSDQFKQFVDESIQKGITRVQDIQTDSGWTMTEVVARHDDPQFPMIFIKWLRRHEYRVEVLSPELDGEIKKLMRKIVGDSSLRLKVERALLSMNYLEKTFIHEVLKKKS